MGDIKKLPKWARDYLENAHATNVQLTERVNAMLREREQMHGARYSPIQYDASPDSSTKWLGLPESTQVRFLLADGFWVVCSIERGALVIRAKDQLAVLPQVANLVHIRCGREDA